MYSELAARVLDADAEPSQTGVRDRDAVDGSEVSRLHVCRVNLSRPDSKHMLVLNEKGRKYLRATRTRNEPQPWHIIIRRRKTGRATPIKVLYDVSLANNAEKSLCKLLALSQN
jgi:hypothetical protein